MRRSERGFYGPTEGEWLFLIALLMACTIGVWEGCRWAYRKVGPHITVTWGEP